MLADKMRTLTANARNIELENFTNSQEYRNIIIGIENEAKLGNYIYVLYTPRMNYSLINALKREGFIVTAESIPMTYGVRVYQLSIEWC